MRDKAIDRITQTERLAANGSSPPGALAGNSPETDQP